jgi:membrane protease YdiL (CAAX protease family)
MNRDAEPPHLPPEADLPIPPATWKPIEAVPVFLIAQVAGGILYQIAQAFPTCGGRFALSGLAGEVAMALTVVLWIRFVDRAPLAALGRPRDPLKDVGIGAAVGVTMVFLGGVILFVIDALVTSIVGHRVAQPEQVDACVRGGWLLATSPVVILAAPLGEEPFFRGFLFRGLRNRFGLWPSAVISGAAFGLVHFQGLNFLLIIPSLAVVGLSFALLFEWRQSLLATIAAHAVFNAVGFVTISWRH